MSRSRGTKATQGINGDAANLQRWMSAGASVEAGTFAIRTEACQYPHHRRSDWVTPESQLICGVCHPPAAEYEGITRRGEQGFDELVVAASSRILRRPASATLEALAQRELELEDEDEAALEALDLEALAQQLPNAAATLEANRAATTERRAQELEAELDAGLDRAAGFSPTSWALDG